VPAAIAVGLLVVVALLGVLVVGLLRSHAEILRALHDLGVHLGDDAATTPRPRPARPTADGVAPPRAGGLGSAPDISGSVPDGGITHLAVNGVEHATMLAFLSTGCGTCGAFWEALGDPQLRLPDPTTRVAIVTGGPEAESPALVRELAPPHVVTVMSSDAWDAYDVPMSPYFVLVDGPSGRIIGEGSGVSWDQVVELLTKSAADAAPSPSLTTMRGRDREALIDDQLMAAGIRPGDPSLYPVAAPAEDER